MHFSEKRLVQLLPKAAETQNSLLISLLAGNCKVETGSHMTGPTATLRLSSPETQVTDRT
jgi:hypothetical protein